MCVCLPESRHRLFDYVKENISSAQQLVLLCRSNQWVKPRLSMKVFTFVLVGTFLATKLQELSTLWLLHEYRGTNLFHRFSEKSVE